MQPGASIQNIAYHARLKPPAVQAALVPKAGHYPTPHDDPQLPDVIVPNSISVGRKPEDQLLSDASVQAVKDQNTKRNLQSNLWFDVSSYLRWASTISLMGGLVLLGQAASTATSMGGAIAAATAAITAGGPIALAFTVGLVFAAATVITSQHSKKLFIERTFDVQDFQMQRQAALIGQSVMRATEREEAWQQAQPSSAATQTSWAEKINPTKAPTHVAALDAAPEQASHAAHR